VRQKPFSIAEFASADLFHSNVNSFYFYWYGTFNARHFCVSFDIAGCLKISELEDGI